MGIYFEKHSVNATKLFLSIIPSNVFTLLVMCGWVIIFGGYVFFKLPK